MTCPDTLLGYGKPMSFFPVDLVRKVWDWDYLERPDERVDCRSEV